MRGTSSSWADVVKEESWATLETTGGCWKENDISIEGDAGRVPAVERAGMRRERA